MSGLSAAVQGVGQILFVDERASAGIDDDSRGFHERNRFPVDKVAGRVGQRAMECDNIAFGEKSFQSYGFDIIGQLFFSFRGFGQYNHAECVCDAGYRTAYIAESDNADTFPGQFENGIFQETEIFATGPFAGFYTPGVIGDVAGYVEQVGKYHLGYRVAAVSRYIGDNDAPIFGGFDIDHIVSGSQYPDVA